MSPLHRGAGLTVWAWGHSPGSDPASAPLELCDCVSCLLSASLAFPVDETEMRVPGP